VPGVSSITISHASIGLAVAVYDCTSTSGVVTLDNVNTLISQGGANPAPSIVASKAGITIVALVSANHATAVALPFTLDAINGGSVNPWTACANDVNSSGGTLTASFTAGGGAWGAVIASFIEVSALSTLETQGRRLKIHDNGDGTFSFTVSMGGVNVADQAIEYEGFRIQIHDNGDGTFSPLTTTTTGASDVQVEYEGFRIKLHPTGSSDPVTGQPMYAVVVVQV